MQLCDLQLAQERKLLFRVQELEKQLTLKGNDIDKQMITKMLAANRRLKEELSKE